MEVRKKIKSSKINKEEPIEKSKKNLKRKKIKNDKKRKTYD